jgi:hypothetical protein
MAEVEAAVDRAEAVVLLVATEAAVGEEAAAEIPQRAVSGD